MEALTSKEDLKSLFEQLKNGRDVADALCITFNQLRYNTASKRQSQLYRTFEIPKKSGGSREITAPNNFWKKVQRRLARILESVYEPKGVVHGFVHQHSVVTNARPHIKRGFILNIDLENFFPAINFGRVRGMFLKPPYNCTQEVATLLAQICCFNNQLPQGAPTSPIVSNMLCSRLDSHLGKLAAAYRCSYTRYADDLTFSTEQTRFPRELAQVKLIDSKLQCLPGKKLLSVIDRNGFRLNLSKSRLQSYYQRQEVTGIITNEKANVRRTYVREVRSLLHNWQTKGLDHCQQDYEFKYVGRRPRNPNLPTPLFKRLVKGKIDYLGMVKGTDDPIFLKFLRQLAVLEPKMVKLSLLQKKVESPNGDYLVPTNTDETEELLEHIWVIEAESKDNVEQGTGFFLNGYGLVTCSHLLGGRETIAIKATSRDGTREYTAKIITRDATKDIAILDIGFIPENGLEASTLEVKRLMPVTVLGFPNHNVGDTGFICAGGVTGFRRDPSSNETLILISSLMLRSGEGGC